MSGAEWFLLALGACGVALLVLFIWGERRADRYFDELDARVDRLRAERETAKPAG